jgi:DNA-nicking Smr family endonuclease
MNYLSFLVQIKSKEGESMGKMSDNDRKLFRTATKGVKPLKPKVGGLANVSPPPPIAKIKTRIKAPDHHAPESFAECFYDATDYTIKSDDILDFSGPGLQRRVLQKLRNGEFSIGAELDLHGKTIDEARKSLTQFLTYCQIKKIKCVHIIHGKGKSTNDHSPILKNQVNTWLRQSPAVLAFHSARIKDGGAGAVYVLLKLQRKENDDKDKIF